MANITVCLMLSGEFIRHIHINEVKSMLSETDADVSLVAIDTSFDNSANPHYVKNFGFSHVIRFFKSLVYDGPFVLLRAEEKMAQVLSSEPTAEEKRANLRRKVSLDELGLLSDVEKIRFVSETEDGITYRIPDDIVDKIKEQSDVVVLMGYNRILRGRILEEPKYGVLSWHECDIRRYRGRPAPFWQFYNDEETAGVTLQRLTEELDGGDLVVCKHADISDCDSLAEVHLRLAELYGSFLSEGVQRLQDPEDGPERLSEEELGTLTYEADAEKWRVVLPALVKTLKRRYLHR